MVKNDFFDLHLKSDNGIKAVCVERCVIDADNDYVRVSADIDGEIISAENSTEYALKKIGEILRGRYEIQSCLTCRYGNFCPIGNRDNNIFCVDDFEPKCKSDLFRVTEDAVEMERRSRTLFDFCDKFKPMSKDYYTYK